MKKILLLFSVMTSIDCINGISPFSIDSINQKNPLNACSNCDSWKENRLIELLDDVVSAKRYWLTVGDKPWYRIITRPLHHWFYFSWQTEIREHVSTLDELQTTLAIKLSRVIGQECQETDDDIHKIINDAKNILKIHGIPIHIARNWLFYLGSAVLAYKIATLYREYLKDTIVIKYNSRDVESVKEACRNSLENHTLTLDKEKEILWLTTSQKKLPELQSHLDFYSVNPLEEPRSATKNDLYRLLLTENNEFAGKTFIRTCGTEPIKNLYNKVLKSGESKKTNLSDLEIQANKEERIKTALETLNAAVTKKNPDGSPKFPKLAAIKVPFYKLPLERMEELINEIPMPILEHIKQEIIGAINKYGVVQAAGKAKEMFSSLFSSTDKSSQQPIEDTLEYKWFQYFLATIKYYTPTVTRSVSNFTNALDFLTESAKMTPLMLTSYLGFRGAVGAHHLYRDRYFKEPLRYDLKDFINFLDENLYTHVSNPAFKGLHYYWTARLKQYKKFMSNKDKIYFEKDLQKLTRGSTISHEIEILRVILYSELEHL